ncbi:MULTISPECIES: hypothetical protein [Sphingomonas]|uniref:Uncharacterized protein n=1 Tax=Sphingomonas molluscorum TaxID=418184 RepID=A0ABU8Q887_9SPHN|nr:MULTISPECIES: hypothetical protein [unclassified Sphingomonas]MBM7407243.1 hypothetical protein [Sphingomonas sp. JUb134]
MKFFTTQNTSSFPIPEAAVPTARRQSAADRQMQAIARAAVREVLG